MINKLLKPKLEVEPSATAVHGYTNEMLKDEQCFGDVYPLLSAILSSGRLVVIHNANFDNGRLAHTCRLHELEPIQYESVCAMNNHAQWYGEPHYQGGFKWQPLWGGDHTALGDCRATLKRIYEMAGREFNDLLLQKVDMYKKVDPDLLRVFGYDGEWIQATSVENAIRIYVQETGDDDDEALDLTSWEERPLTQLDRYWLEDVTVEVYKDEEGLSKYFVPEGGRWFAENGRVYAEATVQQWLTMHPHEQYYYSENNW